MHDQFNSSLALEPYRSSMPAGPVQRPKRILVVAHLARSWSIATFLIVVLPKAEQGHLAPSLELSVLPQF